MQEINTIIIVPIPTALLAWIFGLYYQLIIIEYNILYLQ